MKRIPAVTEEVVVEPAKVVFEVGQLVRIGEGIGSFSFYVTKGMGVDYVPEVKKIKVVQPEKIVFEVGDMVAIYDLSYLLKLNRESHDFTYGSWDYDHGVNFLREDKRVRIIELGLKVPCPGGRPPYRHERFALDSEDNVVYLDTIIMDKTGQYWLTQLRFLGEYHGY